MFPFPLSQGLGSIKIAQLAADFSDQDLQYPPSKLFLFSCFQPRRPRQATPHVMIGAASGLDLLGVGDSSLFLMEADVFFFFLLVAFGLSCDFPCCANSAISLSPSQFSPCHFPSIFFPSSFSPLFFLSDCDPFC